MSYSPGLVSYSPGLIRLRCPGCSFDSFIKVQQVLTAESVPCPRCGRMASAGELEAANPSAARLLGIMRQLALAKERHREQASAAEPALVAGPSLTPPA